MPTQTPFVAPEPREVAGLPCNESTSYGSRARCGKPAAYATRTDPPEPRCKRHAGYALRSSWKRGTIQALTPEVEAVMRAVQTERAERKAAIDAERAAVQKAEHARIVANEWATYDQPYTSSLAMDEGWREGEFNEVEVLVHATGAEPSHWSGSRVVITVGAPGEVSAMTVRGASGITPAHARELAEALSFATEVLEWLNADGAR